MMKKGRLILLIIISMLAAADALAQKPCTDADAYQTAGSWGARPDDLGLADPTFPKALHAPVLAKAQKIIELLKQVAPQPTGLQALTYRQIRGRPYVAGGALPFAVNALFLGYHCMPETSGHLHQRGKIQPGGETATWIYINFNSLGWLTNDNVSLGKKLLTANGETIYFAPKRGGEFRGFTLWLPDVHSNSEAIIISPGDRTPFRPVTREQFVATRIQSLRNEIKASQLNATAVQYYESEIAKLNALLNSMSPDERGAQAVIRSGFAPPETLFISEAQGGKRLVTVDTSVFKSNLPREMIQLVTVYWRWETKSPAKLELIRQFKDNFDFQAVREMLGK